MRIERGKFGFTVYAITAKYVLLDKKIRFTWQQKCFTIVERNQFQVLDILCNLCKGSGVAVRSSQVIIS